MENFDNQETVGSNTGVMDNNDIREVKKTIERHDIVQSRADVTTNISYNYRSNCLESHQHRHYFEQKSSHGIRKKAYPVQDPEISQAIYEDQHKSLRDFQISKLTERENNGITQRIKV
jgi:hypothetical protein